MKNSNLDIFYFSGTGNTLLIVRQLTEEFKKFHKTVKLFKIEKAKPEEVNTDNAICLAFPIACGTTYPFVLEFIKNLPLGNSNEVFIVSTAAKFSAGVLNYIASELSIKNYNVIGTTEFVMPNNLSSGNISPKKKQVIINKSLHKAKIFTHDICLGLRKFSHSKLKAKLFSNVIKSSKIWKFMRKKYILEVNNNKCIRCGLCYNLCPVSNIEMNYYPEFLSKCEMCMRCISFCPTSCINFRGKNFVSYKAVEVSDLV